MSPDSHCCKPSESMRHNSLPAMYTSRMSLALRVRQGHRERRADHARSTCYSASQLRGSQPSCCTAGPLDTCNRRHCAAALASGLVFLSGAKSACTFCTHRCCDSGLDGHHGDNITCNCQQHHLLTCAGLCAPVTILRCACIYTWDTQAFLDWFLVCIVVEDFATLFTRTDGCLASVPSCKLPSNKVLGSLAKNLVIGLQGDQRLPLISHFFLTLRHLLPLPLKSVRKLLRSLSSCAI